MERLMLTSREDETKISVMYLPVEDPIGIVQTCQGMCEHKERYIPFMEYLAGLGFVSVIHDHRGHGESAASIKHLGYFGKEGARHLVDDVYLVTQYIQRHYPNLPLYLFGHSMGSLIVRNYMQSYENALSGLIVCGSPSYNQYVAVGKMLTSLIIKLKGPFYRSRFVNQMAFGYFNHGIKNAKSEHQWICTDEKIVKKYDEDPYCNFIFTVDGFHALFTLMAQAYNKNNYAPKNTKLPILFISGKEDPCLIDTKKFYQAVELLRTVGYQHVEAALYDNMRHEILNELQHQAVFEDIGQWLKRSAK